MGVPVEFGFQVRIGLPGPMINQHIPGTSFACDLRREQHRWESQPYIYLSLRMFL